MTFGSIIPVFRMFDESKAYEFYVGFLGFVIDWKHRFEPGLPIYMQVSRGGCRIHLSEHHGDATPGGAARILITKIDAFHAELSAKAYKYARPGIQETPWRTREITVSDPFGNRLIFYEDLGVDHEERRRDDPRYESS